MFGAFYRCPLDKERQQALILFFNISNKKIKSYKVSSSFTRGIKAKKVQGGGVSLTRPPGFDRVKDRIDSIFRCFFKRV